LRQQQAGSKSSDRRSVVVVVTIAIHFQGTARIADRAVHELCPAAVSRPARERGTWSGVRRSLPQSKPLRAAARPGPALSRGTMATLRPCNPYHRHRMDLALEVNGLTKTYGTFVAVNGLSLSMQRGEVLGLVGPNGAGKTTTLRAI